MKSFLSIFFILLSYYSYSQINLIDEIDENKFIFNSFFLNDSILLYVKANKKENVILYNLKSKEKKIISISKKIVYRATPSFDKKLIAFYSKDKIIRVYDWLNDTILVSFLHDNKYGPYMKFVSEANELAIFDRDDKQLTLYSIIKEKPIKTIDFEGKLFSLDYVPHKELISVTIENGYETQILLYTNDSLYLKHKIVIGEDGAYSPIETKYENLMLIGTSSSVLLLWDIEENKIIKGVYANEGNVYSTLFFNNGENFISYGQDGIIYFWKFDGLALISGIKAHKGQVYRADRLDHSNIFLSMGDDEKIKVWELKNY
ncbi:MAG: hypothetical protein JEY96_19240 [Bacteroidales bacterium]|nr:hypothetical protein [Bacteroidales bacterium]